MLAVRNPDKGRVASKQMTGDVEVARLDVADLSSVRAFADGVGSVDVLINNAGVLGLPFGLSPDGVELHLATNHLGHFALTNLLLPRLTDRVVVLDGLAADPHSCGTKFFTAARVAVSPDGTFEVHLV